MEIYHLRTFATVAKLGQLGHVTNAAKVLHMTQPAVTGHLKALEQELGFALFDRSNSRITLTRRDLLLPDAERTLASMLKMLDAQGLTPNVVMETDEFTMPHNLVRAGLGLALMREDLALSAAKRGEIAVCGHAFVDTQLSFLYSASAEFEPTMTGMLSVLRETWGAAV